MSMKFLEVSRDCADITWPVLVLLLRMQSVSMCYLATPQTTLDHMGSSPEEHSGMGWGSEKCGGTAYQTIFSLLLV